MAQREYGQYCGVTRALELVCERWALLIVLDLLVGTRRYGELAEGRPRIPSNILAARLKELQFVEGTATGHTDSVGTAEYNQKLSERRAQAVVDYLASKGVYQGRIKAIGMGLTKPIADNATEEGRAQNRRVTIRRTDCGPAE